MERWVGRVALVTGSSVGIGAGITRALVKHGMKVVGCARNIKQIEDIKNELKSEKGQLIPMKCDLTKEDEILAMFERIQTELGGVDVCINNAGLAHCAPLLSGNTADWRNMLDVNVLGLCICTREAFQQMKKKGVDDGHIFLINSMSGHRVIPNTNGHFYSATKYAVSGLLEGIRNELREMKSHIRVTAVSPGMVRTEFEIRRTKSREEGEKIYSEYKCLEADDLADAVVYALSAPPHVQSVLYTLILTPLTEQGKGLTVDVADIKGMLTPSGFTGMIHDILLRPTEQTS